MQVCKVCNKEKSVPEFIKDCITCRECRNRENREKTSSSCYRCHQRKTLQDFQTKHVCKECYFYAPKTCKVCSCEKQRKDFKYGSSTCKQCFSKLETERRNKTREAKRGTKRCHRCHEYKIVDKITIINVSYKDFLNIKMNTSLYSF